MQFCACDALDAVLWPGFIQGGELGGGAYRGSARVKLEKPSAWGPILTRMHPPVSRLFLSRCTLSRCAEKNMPRQADEQLSLAHEPA
jgi:hypothetical protein